jgi:LytR cell envelope-related transcriptional attenuator
VNSTRMVLWGLVICGLMLFAVGCAGEKESTPSGDGQPVEKRPIIVVFNGCGVSGCARKMALALKSAGYDIGNGYGENTKSFDYPVTLVVDYVGNPEQARKLAERIGAPVIQQISYDPDRFGTIGVIVGADFRTRLLQLSGE